MNYAVPQENGNRTDVRWASVTNNAGNGLVVVADETMNVSAWPYSLEDLEEATHINKLPKRDFYTLNIDLAQQGVGGTDTWSERARAIPDYRLPTDRAYHFSFLLMPYESVAGNLSDVTNVQF